MRRARLRRKVEILRYRLAMRLGGWLIRDEQAELDALRATLAEVRKARTYSRSSMGRVYDYVRGSDLDRILDGPEEPAPARTPVTGATEAHGTPHDPAECIPCWSRAKHQEGSR
jgi:hypothetical protein